MAKLRDELALGTQSAFAPYVAVLGAHDVALLPKLKGSVGEGPNQTNYSDRSSVRILAKFRNFQFSLENFKRWETFNIF